jgi:hypothetical protein
MVGGPRATIAAVTTAFCARPPVVVALLALTAFGAAAASAQEPAVPPAPATVAPYTETVEPALSVELGSPLWLSANLGIRLPLGEPGLGRGFLLQAQPGIGGGALNLGFVPVSFYAQGMQAISFGVKARLLRTWGSPWGTEPGRTYAGFEAGAALGVKVAVGVLWKVDSGPGDDTIVTWSVGLGM